HHAPDVPAARRAQAQPALHHARHQPRADGHHRGVRRRQPQRRGVGQPAAGAPAARGRRAGHAHLRAPAAVDVGLPRDLARQHLRRRRRQAAQRRRRRRAAVRRRLPAAQHRRLQRRHRRRHGHDAQQQEDVPAPGLRHRLRAQGPRRRRGREGHAGAARPRRPHQPQARAPQVHPGRAASGLRAGGRAALRLHAQRRPLRLGADHAGAQQLHHVRAERPRRQLPRQPAQDRAGRAGARAPAGLPSDLQRPPYRRRRARRRRAAHLGAAGQAPPGQPRLLGPAPALHGLRRPAHLRPGHGR
ncbi:hypothetical protein GGI05_007691, partial [Coemansia sp. RSA 2603]